jgi:hypothetical protein
MREGPRVLNLWNPQVGLPMGWALLTALLLGVVHGITPDEHTWPITFSYAIGSYSTRGGMKSGFFFSVAFTLQRAIGSELAYLALARVLLGLDNNLIYVVVGAVMAASGAYLLRVGRYVRALSFLDRILPAHDHAGPVPVQLALVHGFLAGWGTGAFALIVYTVLAPSMPGVAFGWMPGFFFGLGTMIAQVALGAAVGSFLARQHLPEEARARVGRLVAGRTLLYGGLAFVLAGILGELFPSVVRFGIQTGLHVHNLDSLGLGFFLVVLVVGGIAGLSFADALRQVRSHATPTTRVAQHRPHAYSPGR